MLHVVILGSYVITTLRSIIVFLGGRVYTSDGQLFRVSVFLLHCLSPFISSLKQILQIPLALSCSSTVVSAVCNFTSFHPSLSKCAQTHRPLWGRVIEPWHLSVQREGERGVECVRGGICWVCAKVQPRLVLRQCSAKYYMLTWQINSDKSRDKQNVSIKKMSR